VRKDTTSAATAISTMEGRVLKGKNATFEASSAFKNIATSSGETLRTSRDILTATEVQKTSIGDVVKYVEEVVAIAEQTATGTQQVAGTAKQLSTAMQELTTSSQRLTDIADDLQAGLETFQLSHYEPEPEPEPVRRNGMARYANRAAFEPATAPQNGLAARRSQPRAEAPHLAAGGRPNSTSRRPARPAAAAARPVRPARVVAPAPPRAAQPTAPAARKPAAPAPTAPAVPASNGRAAAAAKPVAKAKAKANAK